jgi:hypothetical protein
MWQPVSRRRQPSAARTTDALEARERPPSWPRVLATTIQLYSSRRARRLLRVKEASAWRTIRITALVLVVLILAGLSVVLYRTTSHSPGAASGGSSTTGISTSAAARIDAASWIAAQVSHDAIVACDPVMCSALESHGFPAANLVVVNSGAHDPMAAELIVATPVLRSQFGSQLQGVYAPVVIASFGTGGTAVQVRAIAPDGAPAYLKQLNADFTARKSIGAGLLHNPKIVAFPAARSQLAAGLVDTRLLSTVFTMAQIYPVRIVDFGDASPGANPEVPLRSATILAGTSGSGSASALSGLRSFLSAQQSPYLPAAIQILRLPSGQTALHFQFTAPSQPGLLDAGLRSVHTPSTRTPST